MNAAEALKLSKPFLTGFSPYVIPYQSEVVGLLRRDFDYSIGTPEVLLSGSYGSAKSILMAHLAVTHCLQNPGARVCLARKSLPDLKDTIFKEILEHLQNYDEETQEGPDLIEGEDYIVREPRGFVRFANGSEIISRSWADKKYKKGRSLKLSGLIFEELTENNDDDMEAFKTLKARLRRLPNVKENFLIAATNPDSPAHWVFKYWMENTSPTKFVFYSVTTDNPYLDPIYIQQLMKDLPPREVERYIFGKWIEIDKERIYYAYQPDNFLKEASYWVRKDEPVALCFDFNIGAGKPMSSAVGQYDHSDDKFHIFGEVVIEGARTLDVMEEWASRGILDLNVVFHVYGDETGQANHTNSIHSDYDQIKKFLANYKTPDDRSLRFEFKLPSKNPPIRERHNSVNSYCLNGLGERRLFVYSTAKVADEGFRLTALKKGADYIEDDTKAYQHITTAIGYWVTYIARQRKTEELRKKLGY